MRTAVREWRQLTADWDRATNRNSATRYARFSYQDVVASVDGVADSARATDDAFAWDENLYDTSVAHERAKQLRDVGIALTCVWSATPIRSSPHIDHCFPWARWPNNDLWNLLPARGKINLSKGDRLPSSRTMADARRRMQGWWENAWVGSPREAQFYMEARYSLPGITVDRPSVDDIFHAALHQRARLMQDKQLVEWQVSAR